MNLEELTECAIDAKVSIANHETRIGTLEETVKDIRDITLSVRELAFSLKQTNENVETLTDEVRNIKEEPKKSWTTLKTAIISAIGGTIGTAIVGGIAALIIYAAK